MSEPTNRDAGGRERPSGRDSRPLFRDEQAEHASPENPTVLLPTAAPRRTPPRQQRMPDATAVMPAQQPAGTFPPVQREGAHVPPLVPGAPARSRPPVPESWFVEPDAPPGGPPTGVPPTAKPARSPKRRGRWRRRLLIALALLVLLPAGLYFFADSRVARADAFPAASTRPPVTPGEDWLIVGSDSRDGLTKAQRKQLATGKPGGKRTDTMMLLHVPASGGKPTLVSLPRDSYVPIRGHGSTRLNAAFAYGGPSLLIETVENLTGIRIDHYAEIGFGGVVDVVDSLGGVQMCVKSAMKDPKAALDIKAGCQNLDGATALGFSRTRASLRGDLDRVGHQRELMTALMKKVASPSTLVNPFKLWPLVMKGTGSLTIDGGDHLLDLGRLAFAAKALGNGGTTTTVPIGGTPTINGAQVLTWDKARSDALFAALRADRKVPKSVLAS